MKKEKASRIENFSLPDSAFKVIKERTKFLFEPMFRTKGLEDLLANAYIQGLADAQETLECNHG